MCELGMTVSKHTRTHTQTIMFFILYGLCIPFTPTLPQNNPFTFFQNTSFCLIYELLSSRGQKKYPRKVKTSYFYIWGDIWCSQSKEYNVDTHTDTTHTVTHTFLWNLFCSEVYYNIHFRVSRWWWQKAAVIAGDVRRKDDNNIQ